MARFFRLETNDERPLNFRVMKDSEIIKVGDWIVDEGTGVANIDAITERVTGFVEDIVTKDKTSLQSATVSTGALGGTWAASTKQYTAAADNTSVDLVMVAYRPVHHNDEVIATLTAAKGTTLGSNKAGYYLATKTTDSSKLDEATSSTTRTNVQFAIVDPYSQGSTTEVIVRVLPELLC